MNKIKIIEELKKQINKIKTLKNKGRKSPEFDGWKSKTRLLIETLCGKESTQLVSFNQISYGLSVISSRTTENDFEAKFQQGLDNAGEIINSIIEHFELIEDVEEESDPYKKAINILENIFKKFNNLVQIHEKRHNNRTHIEFKDEYDIQDFLHIFLVEHFEDVRDEETMPSYAGTAARADFFLKEEKVVIEIKMTRKNLTKRELRDQLIIDKELYKAHPEFDHIVCFVYDPIRIISNINGFISDLEQDNPSFRVFVTQ